MSGLFNALLVGLGLSLASGLAALVAARVLQTRLPGSETTLWRAARLTAIAPVLLAPLAWWIPDAAPAGAATVGEPGGVPLPPGPLADGPAPSPVFMAPADAAVDWTDLVWAILAIGFALSLLAAWRRHRARRRFLAQARAARPAERHCVETLSEALSVRAPELRVGAETGSPFLTGWRGLIWAPENLFHDVSTRRYALAHELVHWRRGDERDRLIGAALTTLIWFHWPLREIERGLDAARELACDAETIDWLGPGERRPYAAALIAMMRRSATMPATAFGPDERRLRQMRIKAVLGARAPRFTNRYVAGAAVLALLAPVGVAQAVLTDGREAPRPVEYVAADQDDLAFGPRAEPRAPEPTAEPTAEPAPVARPAPVAEPAPEAAPEPTPEPAIRPLSAQEASFGVAPSDFTHAVADGRISSRYGPRPARPAGAPVHHGGVDIAAPAGTAVTSPAAGVVTHAELGYDGSERWGNVIVVDHGEGWQTIYAHLDGFDVAAGDSVAAGQQIGRIGTTGASTGPHLHVEVRRNGERVDPSGHLPGLE